MEFPLASFSQKLFVLSLLITLATNATNAKVSSKLVSDICGKTKNPKICFRVFRSRRPTSLHNLGIVSLDVAISYANASVGVFNKALERKDIVKEKFLGCHNNYKLALKELSEAKVDVESKRDYASARKHTEVAAKVPVSCQNELGKPLDLPYKAVIVMSDGTFDVPFVVMKELDRQKPLLNHAASDLNLMLD